MKIKYYHSSGSTHAFYNGETFHYHDSMPNGGIIAYEIRMEGGVHVCNVSGTRPRPITLSSPSSSQQLPRLTSRRIHTTAALLMR